MAIDEGDYFEEDNDYISAEELAVSPLNGICKNTNGFRVTLPGRAAVVVPISLDSAFCVSLPSLGVAPTLRLSHAAHVASILKGEKIESGAKSKFGTRIANQSEVLRTTRSQE